METKWVQVGDTHVLFVLEHLCTIIPEWQPKAQITLRQVYESRPARWYLWVGGEFVTAYDTLEEARRGAAA